MHGGQLLTAEQATGNDALDYLGFLSSAVEEITSTRSYTITLNRVAQTMVPKFSDWCAVDIANRNGQLERLATAHIDPKKIEKALELGRKYPRDPDAPSGTTHVLKTGEPDMYNNITDDMLVSSAVNREHLAMMRDLRFHSLMIVPIKAHGTALGTITLVWAESRKIYTIADLAFAEILAAVAGSAILGARLYNRLPW